MQGRALPFVSNNYYNSTLKFHAFRFLTTLKKSECIYHFFPSFRFLYTQDGISPLYVACQNGHEEIVDTLLMNGANVNLATTVRKKCGF